MIEKYYTPEQLEQLAQRKEQVCDARIKEAEAEWPRLMAEVQAAIKFAEESPEPEMSVLAETTYAGPFAS